MGPFLWVGVSGAYHSMKFSNVDACGSHNQLNADLVLGVWGPLDEYAWCFVLGWETGS